MNKQFNTDINILQEFKYLVLFLKILSLNMILKRKKLRLTSAGNHEFKWEKTKINAVVCKVSSFVGDHVKKNLIQINVSS